MLGEETLRQQAYRFIRNCTAPRTAIFCLVAAAYVAGIVKESSRGCEAEKPSCAFDHPLLLRREYRSIVPEATFFHIARCHQAAPCPWSSPVLPRPFEKLPPRPGPGEYDHWHHGAFASGIPATSLIPAWLRATGCKGCGGGTREPPGRRS